MELWLLLLSSLLLAGIVSKELLVHAWPSLALNDLSPPPGNSLLIKLKTRNGKQHFGCLDEQWRLLSASAELVDVLNSTRAGSYVYSHRSHSGGTWLLSNSPVEYEESGCVASEVSGSELVIQVAGRGFSNVLAEAVEHKFTGKASAVSYIQTFSKAEERLEGNCTGESTLRQVSYEAEYWLWSQDRVPPVETPGDLLVPQDRLVEGFFGKGVVSYFYNGSAWAGREWKGLLYDVPGGDLLGQHYMNQSSLAWELFNPNGFGVIGISSRESVQVADNCMPWSLYRVTNSWGDVMLSLGEFSHVQMVSTRGGIPPSSSSSDAPQLPSTSRPATGAVHNSSFSAVFWFYVK